MANLGKLHTSFLNTVFAASKLDSNPYTALPTIIFLSCMFILLYLQFHRYISPFTRWKTRIYKELIFHWVFFYTTRIWFLFLKFGRFLVSTLDNYVEITFAKKQVFANKTICHTVIFMLILITSMVPLFILSLQEIYRNNIPNFLMWVAEDPWIRSEIGTSGHYLERPAQTVPSYKNRNTAFRSKRSISVDTDIFMDKRYSTFRPCKSMVTVNVVKSIEDLYT